MKVNLEQIGAPALPEGFRYRVHVYEVYENRIDLGVSIIKDAKKKFFGIVPLPWRRGKVVISSVLRLHRDPDLWESSSPVVGEATLLYNLAFKDKG